MKETVLVVAPHPDDETLGCGGALLRHKKNGDRIFWIILTDVHAEHGWSEEVITQTRREIEQVSNAYGFDGTFNLKLATSMLDAVPYQELVAAIASIFTQIKPSVVYLPNRSDIHTDHKVAFNAAMSCCKNFRAPFVKRVLMYECLSETEFSPALAECAFVPNLFIDITEHFDRKVEILRIFASEIMASPLPRSIETVASLARYRGSRIGKEYAEAFCLLFEVNS